MFTIHDEMQLTAEATAALLGAQPDIAQQKLWSHDTLEDSVALMDGADQIRLLWELEALGPVYDDGIVESAAIEALKDGDLDGAERVPDEQPTKDCYGVRWRGGWLWVEPAVECGESAFLAGRWYSSMRDPLYGIASSGTVPAHYVRWSIDNTAKDLKERDWSDKEFRELDRMKTLLEQDLKDAYGGWDGFVQ